MKRQLNRLKEINIVLVEPQEAANIGAVCRAMKTMGITDLSIVSTECYDIDRIKTLSLHAYDLYENHRRFDSLEEALSQSVLSAGTTRRRGKFRKYFSLLPEQLVERVNTLSAGSRVSIVFGRESSGLSDQELACCDLAVRIPTSEAFPSLNLAQAVQVITYTLSRGLCDAGGYTAIDRTRLDEVTETITESFARIDFYKQDERPEVRRFFRDILARSGLSEQEASRLEKMFRKMAAIKIHKQTD